MLFTFKCSYHSIKFLQFEGHSLWELKSADGCTKPSPWIWRVPWKWKVIGCGWSPIYIVYCWFALQVNWKKKNLRTNWRLTENRSFADINSKKFQIPDKYFLIREINIFPTCHSKNDRDFNSTLTENIYAISWKKARKKVF